MGLQFLFLFCAVIPVFGGYIVSVLEASEECISIVYFLDYFTLCWIVTPGNEQ